MCVGCRWFCEGKELQNSPDIQIRSESGGLHSLIIAEAFEDDTGRYTCLASNSIGSDSTSAEIFIEGTSSTDSEGESLIFKSKSGAMPQFKALLHTCTIWMDPNLTILHLSLQRSYKTPQQLRDELWYWNAESEDSLQFMLSGFDRVLKFKILQISEFSKKVVNQSPTINKHFIALNNISYPLIEEICTLVIAEAFPEDSGIFTCTATNEHGSVTSSAQLVVCSANLESSIHESLIRDDDFHHFPSLPPAEISCLELPPKKHTEIHQANSTELKSGVTDLQQQFNLSEEKTNGIHPIHGVNGMINSKPNGDKSTPPPAVLLSPTKEPPPVLAKPKLRVIPEECKLNGSYSFPCFSLADAEINCRILLGKLSSTPLDKHIVQWVSKLAYELSTEDELMSGDRAWTVNGLQNQQGPQKIQQLQNQIRLEQESGQWYRHQQQPDHHQHPPSSPSFPPPPSFQELEPSQPATSPVPMSILNSHTSPTMQSSGSFNYARPKQFIAAQNISPASGYVTPSSGSSTSSLPSPLSPTASQKQFGRVPVPPFSQQFAPEGDLSPTPRFPNSGQSPAAFLSSMLPSQPPPISVNALGLPKGVTPPGFPKKTGRTARIASDEEIQGSKDAVIQDLERKLRFKEDLLNNGQPEYKVSSFEQRLISEIEYRLERSPVEESDDEVQHGDEPIDNSMSPYFEIKLKHYKIFEGMPVTFTCKVAGNPKPKIYWFKDGKQISKRSDHYRIQREPDGTCSLHTAASTLDDDGNYTIMAANPQVSGLPTPDLSWQLNGRPIRPDSSHKMLVRENGVHSLIIEPVTSRDAGIYTCIASNRAGENTFSLELIVAAKEVQKAPVFIEKLQNTGVTEGFPVRLECRISGEPSPQIFWKKENESLTYNTDRVSMHQDNYGYICLLIQGATKEDAGWYTVSAKNEAGIVSCTARLDVYTQWQQPPQTTKPKKVRPSASRYAALCDQGLDIKAAFQPEANPVHLTMQPGLVESDDL
ncbi:hypothetical protein BTVI_14297 [Pitangus sulphuratus]|nr:hypothetical protein BTVI_14297 [Pitangus sulphuratus]